MKDPMEPTALHISVHDRAGRAQAEGGDVVFVHGLDDDHHLWDGVVEQVADRARWLGVDLPGHGRSDAPTDPDAYRRDAVLDALDAALAPLVDPDTPTVLVGHSLGGYLGLAHTITRPGRFDALVLVATGPGFRDPDARADWNGRVERNAPDYDISEAAARIAFHVDSIVIDRITEVTVPVELVVGSRDKGFLGANDYLERKLHDVRRTTVDDGGHKVMRSHPEVVAAAIDAALTRAR